MVALMEMLEVGYLVQKWVENMVFLMVHWQVDLLEKQAVGKKVHL